MRKLPPACLAVALTLPLALLPLRVQAQEEPDRFMLEAGTVGGNSIACPGHYVGVNGRVAGPVSLYGMVENYRCDEQTGSATLVGASVLLGRSDWLVRPALRAGIEYDEGVAPTGGASLTFGRSYGARLILHVGDEIEGTNLVLFLIGGYISF